MDGVEAAEYTDRSPLDTEEGRLTLAILRLLADERDDLAWRTALQLTKGVGSASLRAVRDWARENNVHFETALQTIKEDPKRVRRVGGSIAEAVAMYEGLLEKLSDGTTSLQEVLRRVVQETVTEEERREETVSFLNTVVEEIDAKSLNDLVAGLSASLDAGEQELLEGAVNILTMHKAKGLSADVVFIVGAEDEFIPGWNEGPGEGDERRLLFVSMSRARHRLFISYCRERTGRQAYLGRESGTSERTLTRFLQDAPIRAEDGCAYVLNSIRGED
jgi:superfamily I DNA/RNA helicase